MLVKNVDILVSSVEEKVNNNTHLPYLAIKILSLPDGDSFNVLERDAEKFGLYQPMEKYKVDLKITSNQYGISVAIENVLRDLGNILTINKKESMAKIKEKIKKNFNTLLFILLLLIC